MGLLLVVTNVTTQKSILLAKIKKKVICLLGKITVEFAYLNVVMVKILVDTKLVWLGKPVCIYQLTNMFSSLGLINEVNRETFVVVNAFESAFTNT